ncbi:MAG: hypothetical protein HWE20_09235 [Gammaproteobacteria bacterium]|nr:hypothetical protein [Gammaproteobacteria bacterium]
MDKLLLLDLLASVQFVVVVSDEQALSPETGLMEEIVEAAYHANARPEGSLLIEFEGSQFRYETSDFEASKLKIEVEK